MAEIGRNAVSSLLEIFTVVAAATITAISKTEAFAFVIFAPTLTTTALSTSRKSEQHVKCTGVLNVVGPESSAVFQLFSTKDKSHLARKNALYIQESKFDIQNSGISSHFQCHGYSSHRFDKDLDSIVVQFIKLRMLRNSVTNRVYTKFVSFLNG